LVTNQYVNSYKRLVNKGVVPTSLSWDRTNRSALVRVPGYRPHTPDACRIELRSPDPSANPYLTFAVMLAAGLAGIEEGLMPGDPIDRCDVAAHGSHGLGIDGGAALPTTLGEAVERFAQSSLMKKTLGEHIHSYLVETKRAEWVAYLTHVSPWELDRYLAVL
jgi:glutamine synthetase